MCARGEREKINAHQLCVLRIELRPLVMTDDLHKFWTVPYEINHRRL